MKKTLLLFLSTICSIALSATEGALSGKFTINKDGDQVVFSQGNLQYQASTDTWQFAENQWDMIGEDNANISFTYTGWIDLFGWGTGDSPYKSSIFHYDYPDFTDWGENAIANGGNITNAWRTLTSDEWNYLLNDRTDAPLLHGQAQIDGVYGYVLLPDGWNMSNGLSFTAQPNNWTTNAYSEREWAMMETAGAVFLPCAGYRIGWTLFGVDYGGYWTSTGDYYGADCFSFGESSFGINRNALSNGESVRLVRDLPRLASEKKLKGRFSVDNEGKQVIFSQGNLQYHAIENKWQFAQEQYTIAGKNNELISPTANVWIDLFGWGTSGFAHRYPYMTSTDTEDYGNGTEDITGTNYDWGVYNPINNGGNQKGLWRTMTDTEWEYILIIRPNAAKLQSIGTVDGVYGYIILPDEWKLPEDLWFTANSTKWDRNEYTIAEWAKMEDAGAVFLPAAGFREGTSVDDINRFGFYWTSVANPDNMEEVQMVSFGDGDSYKKAVIEYSTFRDWGYSVRLVQEAPAQTGIEEIAAEASRQQQAVKVLDPATGTIYIIRNGKAYNLMGGDVK